SLGSAAATNSKTPGARPPRHGGGWVGGQMSVFRLAAGVIALAIGAAVVTALAANPEVKSDPAAAAAIAANSEANADPAAPAAAKRDRLSVRPPLKPAAPAPVTSACPQEPWPYGCQWRTPPARKVYRATRPG